MNYSSPHIISAFDPAVERFSKTGIEIIHAQQAQEDNKAFNPISQAGLAEKGCVKLIKRYFV